MPRWRRRRRCRKRFDCIDACIDGCIDALEAGAHEMPVRAGQAACRTCGETRCRGITWVGSGSRRGRPRYRLGRVPFWWSWRG
jgi:hypothetical protein